MLYFKLFGPFALTDDTGIDRRPKLLKARAILAVLAATPGHRHTRSWFQTLLWGDRQHEQALASLRSALTDIRRGLGPNSAALITNNTEIGLDPAFIKTDVSDRSATNATFLEGFDVAYAEGFEDWLRETRSANDNRLSLPAQVSQTVQPIADTGLVKLYIAPTQGNRNTITQMRCDALIDGLAKSVEEFGLGQTIEGRFRSGAPEDQLECAAAQGCGLMLLGETIESQSGAMVRLKVIDVSDQRMFWSKSLTGENTIDFDDPSTIAVVAEFIDILSHRLARRVSWQSEDVSPDLLALAGVNQAFKLGIQNMELADSLLKKAYSLNPKGVHLAWRGFLRTFAMCEHNFASPEVVIEEGISFARRALEADPHNSMVLALCAQVENVMNLSPERGLELSKRALEINRCNPMAWASLGLSSAYLGNAENGKKVSKLAAKLAEGSWYSAQADCWASAASVMSGDAEGARQFAERSHRKSESYAPPMRYLSALYCLDGQYDRAISIAEKLREREPDFTFSTLQQDGYPVQSLRQGNVLYALPGREI